MKAQLEHYELNELKKGANIRGEDNDAGCLNFSIRGGAGAGQGGNLEMN